MMGFTSAAMYHMQIKGAKDRFDREGNRNVFMADSGFVAVSMVAAVLAKSNPALKHLPKAVAAAKHGIKSAFEMVSEKLDCPIECDHDEESFVSHFWSHAGDYVDRDLTALHDIAEKLGMADSSQGND